MGSVTGCTPVLASRLGMNAAGLAHLMLIRNGSQTLCRGAGAGVESGMSLTTPGFRSLDFSQRGVDGTGAHHHVRQTPALCSPLHRRMQRANSSPRTETHPCPTCRRPEPLGRQLRRYTAKDPLADASWSPLRPPLALRVSGLNQHGVAESTKSSSAGDKVHPTMSLAD